MSELLKKITENISDLVFLENFLIRMAEIEFFFNLFCGFREPSEESKKRIILVAQAFWINFLKRNPSKKEVREKVVSTVGTLFHANLAENSPILFSSFTKWSIKELADNISKLFEEKDAEAKEVFMKFVLTIQHNLNTPLGALSQEKF